MVRSFIAVEVDDALILDKICQVQQTLRDCGADLKTVKRENIHLTLRFLGEIGEGGVSEIIELLKEVNFKPFELSLKGVGVFPNQRYIRVIWLGLKQGEKELGEIASLIEQRLRTLRFPADNKRFSPHLTIARVRSKRNNDNLIPYLQEWKDRDFGQQLVNTIHLKKSVLTPLGPIYSTLFERKAEI
ncbi:RNA 2',3'-cyclic phosphodiesterase [[Eubacterium] cellulosolvens]